MNKVIILGSGAAVGVPTISDGWGQCNPQNPKNRRSRAGIYIEINDNKFLIDTSAELRNQLLVNDIHHIDAVFYTHTHADHIMGIDDLRAMNYHIYNISGMNKPKNAHLLDIYASETHLAEIRQRFNYVLADEKSTEITHRPQLMPKVIQYGKIIQINGTEIIPLEFSGHPIPTTGYVFNNGELVIIPDYKTIPQQTLEYLQKINVNVLIMPLTAVHECLYHAGMDINLHYIKLIMPKKVIFTHLGPECDYDAVKELCPADIEPAFDNMQIEL